MPGSSGNGRRETGAQPCGFIAWRATNGAPLRGCGADPGEPGPPVTGSGEKEREMKEAVITGAARTAAGSFLWSLADIPAPKLGAVAIAEGGCGARAKEEDEVVGAGGMESMSRAPYILKRGRTGYRLGNDTIYDHMMIDGLIDAYNGIHMGNCAEMLSREHHITREDQDVFAANSYRRALAATRDGRFEREVVGVEIPQKKGPPVVFRVDEEPGRGNIDKFPSLKPVFEKEGTVTAGNASTINDGAAAVVVMSAEAAGRRGIKPIARILGYTTASLEPVWFTVAPIDAIRKLLRKTGGEKDQGGLYEINEDFSSVGIGAIRGLELAPARVNVHGGAVALGHPVGASGA